LNYNTPELVYDCLASITKQIDFEYEIIVVDNGSDKKVDEEKIKSYPNASCYLLEKNLGFGQGNNFGAEKTKGELLWLLNSDTIVPDQSISKLVSYMEADPSIGVASPVLYNDLSCIETQPDYYANFQTLKTLISRRPRDNASYDSVFFETDIVVGASMFIRRNIYEKIGGFDAKIFMFMEDDDICYRVKQLGLKVIVFYQSKIVHLQGKSISKSKDRKKMYYRSQDYFWQKHYGTVQTLIMKVIRWPIKMIKS